MWLVISKPKFSKLDDDQIEPLLNSRDSMLRIVSCSLYDTSVHLVGFESAATHLVELQIVYFTIGAEFDHFEMLHIGVCAVAQFSLCVVNTDNVCLNRP